MELSFTSDAAVFSPDEVRVRGARGRHRLSQPYEYEIWLEADIDGGLSADAIAALLREPCTLVMGSGDMAPLEIAGVLRRIELEPAMSAQPVRYRATLVPKLARASLAYGSRTFQELSAPEIVTRVLDEHGIDYELQLEETYPAREYTVQYEESDLAFVSRLLEHWGIFYYFESVAGGERMILGDSSHAFRPLEDHAELPYVMQVEEAGWSETGGVSMLGRVHEVQSERVVVKDYNWRHPRVVPEGEAAADAQSGYGVVRGYGEHVKDPTEAAHIAAVRAEERLVARELYEGQVSVPRLLPGHRFSLGDAPLGDLDQDYAVIEIEHSLGVDASGFDGAGHLQKRFTAIPLAVRYRPPRVTPKPIIAGFMHAIVDGEHDGTAAPIDELGRYKLLLPYDHGAQPGGGASRWVRMAQSSSGAGYGMHLPLHVGCEVALMHLGGDPDRPVIVGAVPNAATTSPVTREEATKSRIRTRQGILIELEDDGP